MALADPSNPQTGIDRATILKCGPLREDVSPGSRAHFAVRHLQPTPAIEPPGPWTVSRWTGLAGGGKKWFKPLVFTG